MWRKGIGLRSVKVSGQFSLKIISGAEEEAGKLGWMLTYFVFGIGKSVLNLHS